MGSNPITRSRIAQEYHIDSRRAQRSSKNEVGLPAPRFNHWFSYDRSRKKFIFSDENKKLLAKDAEFVNKRVFTDIYYDTNSFSLTLNDKWLRSREGRFELKLPLHEGADRLADQYDELEDEQKIRKALNLPPKGNLADDLIRAGYFHFCTCKTTRKKYKKEPFTIDLDIVDFQDFTYNLGEIELMVNEKSETKGAIDKIMSFAKALKLTTTPTRGKVIEYLKRKRPKHYQNLIHAGVVKDF